MSKAKIFLASMVWLILLSIGVFIYRLWYVPTVAKHQEQQQAELLDATTGSSSYKHRLRIGLDAFSGYAILRSDAMLQQLRSQEIKVDYVDDGADYTQRLDDLAAGKLQMAAFPIDALLKASEAKKSLPATIVALLDESRGADAIVANKTKYVNVDSLNLSGTKFVLVGGSPSETLVRALMRNYQIERVSADSFVRLGSEKELLTRYQAATAQTAEVFVTWQPLVSQLLENDQMHVLTDSGKESGYVVDALVVSRDFLSKNEPVVRLVLESYFRALYSYSDEADRIALIQQDTEGSTARLSAEQAKSLVNGIVWKNTQENLAHFGLRSASVTHIEDMIDRIKRVLLETGGLTVDPTDGDSRKLFNESALRDLQSFGFHPGMSPESVREDTLLPPLSELQWSQLVSVGTAQVPPLIYARGTARLTETSLAKLDDLVEKLRGWPNYYIMVRGNASSVGDADANRTLAKQRADAALQYLISKGVPESRMHAMDGEISGQTSVTFVLGQPPY